MKGGGTVTSQNTSLPPGLYPGIIPPDGTQLILEHWLVILKLTSDDQDGLLKVLGRNKNPFRRILGNAWIDASGIRRYISEISSIEPQDDPPTVKGDR
jgi:hypothetical protein